MTQDLWEKYQTTCFVLPEKINLHSLGDCPRIESLLRKNGFCPIFPIKFVKYNKYSPHLIEKCTQNRFPSLRHLFSDSLQQICQTFAIISARNPQGKEQSLHLNLESEKSMQQCLKKYGYEYNRIYGCSPDLDYVEPSWLIALPDRENAIELAAMFRQHALFWVSNDQLYLVPCSHLFYPEINLGSFAKRVMLANLILDKANT